MEQEINNPCFRCGGFGFLNRRTPNGFTKVVCNVCEGTKVRTLKCFKCKGKIETYKQINGKWGAYIKSLDCIRFDGKLGNNYFCKVVTNCESEAEALERFKVDSVLS